MVFGKYSIPMVAKNIEEDPLFSKHNSVAVYVK
jgi:hypothetical protein